MAERVAVMTGGCQCGALRYALYDEPSDGNICHCRMCQKAFGNFFAALIGVPRSAFAWTRGEPAIFRSSEAVERGFCRDCGTPLSFRYVDRERIAVSIGSLDQPDRVTVVKQYGLESRLPPVLALNDLPGETTAQWMPADRAPKLRSRQHPDHD